MKIWGNEINIQLGGLVEPLVLIITKTNLSQIIFIKPLAKNISKLLKLLDLLFHKHQ